MTNTTGSVNRKDLLMAAAALLLGILFDFLFYGKSVGLSYPLFISAWLLYYFRSNRGRVVLRKDFGLFLLVSLSLLSMTFMLFHNPVLRALNLLAVPLLLALFSEHAAGLHGNLSWGWRRVSAVIPRLTLKTIGSMPLAVKIPVSRLRLLRGGAHLQTAVKIAVGLLLSLPLVILAGVLLSSADKKFEQALVHVPNWFGELQLGELLFRTITILFVGCYIFGLAWSVQRDSAQGAEEGEPFPRTPEASPLYLDPIIIATVLLAVNALYGLFTGIQFTYLFGGGQGVLPDGLTYAEYARRGFGEVVIVSVVNFGLMLGSQLLSPSGLSLTGKLVRPLLVLLLGNTAVLMVSAYVRLVMYEEAYGYTYTRFFVNAFLLWLALMLILMLVKMVRPHRALFRTAFALTVASYVLLNYVNVDVVIAKQNIHRYRETGNMDWYYLNGLSYDAVPTLVKLYKSDAHAVELGHGLARKKDRLEREQAPWSSFHLAKSRAQRKLQDLVYGP